MKSKIYSGDYVKATTKGQLWIPVFLTIGFLIAFPVAELIMLGNWMGMNYDAVQMGVLYENLWRDGFVNTGFVVSIVAAFCNAVSGYWYLYSSRKVDFYHSLPVKREHMFLHKLYVGLIYYLVPYAVMEFMTICIGAARGFFSLHLMKLALYMMVIHVLLYLMMYFSIVLVITVTGTIFMGVLCLGGLMGYAPMLGLLLHAYEAVCFNSYYRDFDAFESHQILMKRLSPISIGSDFIVRYNEGRFRGVLVYLTGAILVFGAGAYLAYRQRPSERTGKSLVYPWTEQVIGFLVTVPAGLGVGIIFASMLTKTNNLMLTWWIFGLILGTMLTHGVLQVIFCMDFRAFFSRIPQLLAASAMVALCLVTFRMDLIGFDRYMPEYDELEDISFSLNHMGNYASLLNVPVGEDGVVDETVYDRNKLFFQRAGGFGKSQEIYDAVERIVNKDLESNGIYSELPFAYKLKSGKTVIRRYAVSAEEIKNLVLACYREGTMKDIQFSFLRIDDQYLKSVEGVFYDGQYYSLFQNRKQKMKELMTALRQDVEETDPETLMGIPCAGLHIYYEKAPSKGSLNRMVPGTENTTDLGTSIYVYPEFKRTVAILKETGYPMTMEEIPAKTVEAVYYSYSDYESSNERVIYSMIPADDSDKTDTIFSGEDEEIFYISEEEMKQLKEALVPYILVPGWVKTIENVSMVIPGEDEANTLGSFELLTDTAPGFVKEKAQEAMDKRSMDQNLYAEEEFAEAESEF